MTNDLPSERLESPEILDSSLETAAPNDGLELAGLLSGDGHFENDLLSPKEEEIERQIKRVHKELFCFHCNRSEYHVPVKSNRLFSSFILGVTLGLVKWIGPFYCRCCGNSRLIWWDRANPRYHWVQWQYRHPGKNRRRRRD